MIESEGSQPDEDRAQQTTTQTTPTHIAQLRIVHLPPIIRHLHHALEQRGITTHATDDDTQDAETSTPSALRRFTLSATAAVLEDEAEARRLEKPLAHHAEKRASEVRFPRRVFSVADRASFDGVDEPGFFSSAETAELVTSILDSVRIEPLALNAALAASGIEASRLSEYERGLLGALARLDLVVDVSPLHASGRYDAWRSSARRLLMSPLDLLRAPLVELDSLRHYWGLDVAWYFGWMSHYCRALVFPAIGGLYVWLARSSDGTIDDDARAPLFALATAAWAGLVCCSWERRQSELAFRWGVSDGSSSVARTNDDSSAVRPNFIGEWRASAVSGEMELAAPADQWRRRAASALSTLASLVVPLAFMMLSLNLQGYVSPSARRLVGVPFYVESAAAFAQPGALFDPTSTLALVPTLLHAIGVNLLNRGFRRVARTLTDYENPRTKLEWRNSFALKRFAFEACDCFLSLFYIAFELQDVPRLRVELVSLFSVDCLRRVSLESLLPYALQRLDEAREGPGGGSVAEHEASLEEYDDFEDWLEMVIQFGYVTLFASAFPLAATIAMGCNAVEMVSDLWKLSHVCRRPSPSRPSSIGVWHKLLWAIAVCSVFSNLALIGFSSSQLSLLVPSWFDTNRQPSTNAPRGFRLRGRRAGRVADGSGRYVLLLLVAAEHVLLLVFWIGKQTLARAPASVRLATAQRAHESSGAPADKAEATKQRATTALQRREAERRAELESWSWPDLQES